MEARTLEAGEIVQLNEKVNNRALAGCLMVVAEPKDWGAEGYVQAVGPDRDTPGGRVYYRAAWLELEEVLCQVRVRSGWKEETDAS